MPRSVATVVENNFVKGLITEATGLQYPENSVVETYDCIFDVLGAVQRRKGFDYEYGYTTALIDKTACAINTYQWKNVTGDGLISFVVVQVGSTLRFYASTDGSTSLSGNLSAGTINLLSYQVPTSPTVAQYECQFADGLGKLYVTHPCLTNFYVTYSAGAFTATAYDIVVRDFEGVNDTYPPDYRPGTLTTNDLHRYNLINQGWDTAKINTFQAAPASGGGYPSNADVWWVYKDQTDVFNPAVTIPNNYRGNTLAPKGHLLLSLYANNRDTASGLSGINSKPTVARTSAVAFFASRVWYSGIADVGFNSKIYFTQIIQRDSQVGNCYQASDPTSETLFDLLPDDGGVISIPEAGTIYKMVPVQNSIIVFAYRGIWQISGSTGLGFTATDYVISKLSSVRSVSNTSYVDVNGLPIFWNTDGIWAIQPNKDGGLTVAPVTRSNIQTFYDEIPTGSKLYARGFFNPLTQTVSWLYRSTIGTTPDENYAFDRVLVLNVLTGAFYPWTISPGVAVHGLVVIDGTGGLTQELQIIDNAADNVVDDAGNLIQGYTLTNISIAPKTKFLVSKPTGATYNFTFAETNNDSYVDWVSPASPTSYESYFITGYKLHGQANKNFQANYVTVYNEGTGSLYVQGVWDFSIYTGNGRFTNKQLCSYDDDGYTNNFKRLKIRGQGKSLQFKISSLNDNDFNVIGWSSWETSNTAT